MIEASAEAPAALARRTIAHHSRSFALASRLLGPRMRDDAAIVYTFCRWVDDAIDERGETKEGGGPGGFAGGSDREESAPRGIDARGGDARKALIRLYHQLDTVYAGTARDPLLAAFAGIVHARAIPRHYPGELLAGMTMDALGTRYTSLDQLHGYAFRVAGVVGLMMCHVFGVRDDAALVPAARLGIAMQLTNICRDVVEDWRRGRCYLPDDLLARHGAGGLADEVGGALPRRALRPIGHVVRELLGLADLQYRHARAGIPALPWRAALAVRAAASIYAAIGDVIAARGYNVAAPRAVVSRARKLVLVAAAASRTLASLPACAFAGPIHVPARVVELRDVPA